MSQYTESLDLLRNSPLNDKQSNDSWIDYDQLSEWNQIPEYQNQTNERANLRQYNSAENFDPETNFKKQSNDLTSNIISYSTPEKDSTWITSTNKNSETAPCQTIESWPPGQTKRKGDNATFGNVDTNDIRADTIYRYPKTIYVPGNFPDIGSALQSIKDNDKGGPDVGTVIILKNGCHKLTTDYEGAANYIKITAQSSDVLPTMANFYGQNVGHSQANIQTLTNQYQAEIGGLGPYRLDVCNNRVTVFGQINPNFNGLKFGDILYWRDSCGEINNHRVVGTEFNTIWTSNCISQQSIQEGEGFWISPRVTVQSVGSRKVICQSRLEWHGIHMQCPIDELKNDDFGHDQLSQFLTGANSGHNQLRHCFVSGNIGLVGSANIPHPNVYTGIVYHQIGSGGSTYYQALIGCSAQLLSEGWNGSYTGAAFIGNNRSVYSWGCGTVCLAGSSFLDCQLGCQTRFANLNVPGCLFSDCKVAAECQAGKLNSRNEIFSLPPPLIRNCQIGFSYNQSCRGDHRTVLTSNNDIDLIVDGTKYKSWNQFPSGRHGSGLSYLFYDEQIELPE